MVWGSRTLRPAFSGTNDSGVLVMKNAIEKMKKGEPVTILALGDSITGDLVLKNLSQIILPSLKGICGRIGRKNGSKRLNQVKHLHCNTERPHLSLKMASPREFHEKVSHLR